MPVYIRAPPSSTSACASCNACRRARPGIPYLSPLSLRLFRRAVVAAPSSLPFIAATRRYCRAVVAALMSPRNFRRAVVAMPLSWRRCRCLSPHRCRRAVVAACRRAVVAAPLSPRCCRRLSQCLFRCAVASAPLLLPVAAPLSLCRCGRAMFATPLSAIRRAVGAATLSLHLCRCAVIAAPLSMRRCRCAVVAAPLSLRRCRCAVVAAPLSVPIIAPVSLRRRCRRSDAPLSMRRCRRAVVATHLSPRCCRCAVVTVPLSPRHRRFCLCNKKKSNIPFVTYNAHRQQACTLDEPQKLAAPANVNCHCSRIIKHHKNKLAQQLQALNRSIRHTRAAACPPSTEGNFASVEGHLAEPQKLAAPANVNCHCSRIIKHHENMLAQQLQALNRSIRHTRSAACPPSTEGKRFCNF